MWALNSKTSYTAERTWVRDKTAAHHWVVAVKATSTIRLDGKLTLADEQPPPLLVPEFWGEPVPVSMRVADVERCRRAPDDVGSKTIHQPAHPLRGRLRRLRFHRPLRTQRGSWSFVGSNPGWRYSLNHWKENSVER